jgi:foldase protein PrsA
VNTGRTTFVSSSTRRLRRAAAACAAILALALVGACGKDGAGQRPFDSAGLAAEVGDERITVDELTKAVDAADKASQGKRTRDAITRDLLSTKIRLELYRQAATRMGVPVGDAEFATTRETLSKDPQVEQAGGFDAFIASQGLSQEEVADIVQRITYERVLGEKLIADTAVTDEELRALFEANAAELETVHTAHILVKEEALAKEILAKVKAGGDFAALAKKHSIDTGSKDKGGDLGSTARGQFVPEFDKAAFDGKPGDIVGPVKTQFGYHIIKIIDRATFESVKESMRPQAGQRIGSDRLKVDIAKAISETGLRVNPRFGRWDDKQFLVVPDDDTNAPSSPIAPATGPADATRPPAG